MSSSVPLEKACLLRNRRDRVVDLPIEPYRAPGSPRPPYVRSPRCARYVSSGRWCFE